MIDLAQRYKGIVFYNPKECRCLMDMRTVELIIKDLEEKEKQDKILKILKEFLSEANTGTGWIEININPNHDILDSEEHKKKQLLIKEWLNEKNH